jgi:hypothetical protein
MFIRIADGVYPLTFENVGLDHPSKAIPPTITDYDLWALGFARVTQTPAPAIDPLTQQATEGVPEIIDGAYHRTWLITDLPQEALAEQITGRKTLMLSQVEQLRDSKRFADVSAHGRQWQADPVSKGLMADAINLAQSGAPLPSVWRDVDNNDMQITSIQDLLIIGAAMATQTEYAYGWSWAKKAEVNTAVSMAELDAVEIE